MPASILYEPDHVCVLHASGVVKRSEFGAAQDSLVHKIDAGEHPRILAILEDFKGWERGADWNDLDYLLAYSHEIARIAIVGEPAWEAEALAFAGAGFRRAPVKFFPTGQIAVARAWLME